MQQKIANEAHLIENQMKQFVLKEWKSPARAAWEHLLYGWILTAIGAGAISAVQLNATGSVNLPTIAGPSLAAAVLSLFFSLRAYLSAHGDQVASAQQQLAISQVAPGMNVKDILQSDILPFIRQELSTNGGQIQQQLSSQLAMHVSGLASQSGKDGFSSNRRNLPLSTLSP